ncbi:MAG: hypothetical protein V7K21_23330 [Nostoc sp.]
MNLCIFQVNLLKMYFLTFSLNFDRDPGLEEGRLYLRHLEKGMLQVWVATSATARKQFPESFHQKGSMIPPEYRVLELKFWTVNTKPISMKEKKGVEGNFYQILPSDVKTDKGGVRGDFGIHKDANVPGSMGCIVLTPERFQGFEKEVTQLAKEGKDSIPLFVTYN